MKKCDIMPVNLVSRTFTILQHPGTYQRKIIARISLTDALLCALLGINQRAKTVFNVYLQYMYCYVYLHFVDMALVDALLDVGQAAYVQRRMRQRGVHPRQAEDGEEGRHERHDEEIPVVGGALLQSV